MNEYEFKYHLTSVACKVGFTNYILGFILGLLAGKRI